MQLPPAGTSKAEMSSSNDRTQQGALGRLSVLQHTAEFLRGSFPSLWEERENRAAQNAPSQEGARSSNQDAPEQPRQQVAFSNERSVPIPIPGASRSSGRWRQPAREPQAFLHKVYAERRNHINGRAKRHSPVFDDNENIYANGYHGIAAAEDYTEVSPPGMHGYRPRHRRGANNEDPDASDESM